MLPLIQKKSLPEIIKVGTDESGYLYLAKTKSITVGERQELSEHERKRGQGSVMASNLINKIAKEKSISTVEARNLLGGIDNLDNSQIVEEYAKEFYDLSTFIGSADLDIKVAVAHIIIKNRVAYPIKVAVDGNINDKKLTVEPLTVNLTHKQGIRIGSSYIIAEGNYEIDNTLIKTQPLPASIKAGSVGFLSSNYFYVLGSSEWTLEMTKQLDEILINDIYDFFQNESNRWESVETVVQDEPGEDKTQLALPMA